MERIFAVAMLIGVALFQAPAAGAQTQAVAGSNPALKSGSPSGDLPAVPPAPGGKSTIMGGEIRNVDPLSDQFSLNVFGQKPIKILYDERTRFYRDGKPIPLLELTPADHASVQTILDGTKVFALSIHILSQSPEGECQGRVLSYSPSSGQLAVDSSLTHAPIKLLVPPGTPVVRVGQGTFTSGNAGSSDLVGGAIVTVKFAPDGKGRVVASRIEILAVPGSAFVFAGSVLSLDLHTGSLVVVDPRDGNSYIIFFDSARTPESQSLHIGEQVRVSATYNGEHYVADEIAAR
ncbi:MAG: DUF5666 domain-containing protein [Terracidiphilus sp.]